MDKQGFLFANGTAQVFLDPNTLSEDGPPTPTPPRARELKTDTKCCLIVYVFVSASVYVIRRFLYIV